MHHIPIIILFLINQCITLEEPPIIELFDEDRIHLTIDFCPITVTDPNNPSTTFVSFTGRCHCHYDPVTETSFDCSSPGPTFIFYPGTKVHMTWHNIFEGSPSNPAFANQYRDISVWNQHTHGFHIDPDEDDVILHINPQETYTYTYTIPSDHYPGTHHIHPHHHGSTSFYIHSGAYSMAIIEYDEVRAEQEYDPNLLNMGENQLIASFIYGVDRSVCNCNGNFESFFEEITQREEIRSYCLEYCSFPATQRNAENYEYDMVSDVSNEFQLYLINGQFQPVIDDMVAGRWRRIRLLNMMSQLVMQFRLPLNGCQWFLLAKDGIYLRENEPRDLSSAPYNGEFVIPSAGRADFAVQCNAGTYSVISSTNNIDAELSNLPRMGGNILLFSMEVNTVNSNFANLEGNDVTNLPTRFPDKPFYLRDLSGVNDIEDCECTSFGGGCDVEMRAQNGDHVINRLEFEDDQPMQLLQKDAVYDFTLALNGHIYHQHVYPFQVVNTVNTGLLAEAGDWMDTISAVNTDVVIRTALVDFSGKMMVHCHNLPHEDEGMMTYYDIMNDLNTGTCTDRDPKIPTEQPTFSPLSIVDVITEQPTSLPTTNPTVAPTTSNPTTALPTTVEPTTSEPTTANPTTVSPTKEPTRLPTQNPTVNPTKTPTTDPSTDTTASPTSDPTTAEPTTEPTTSEPTTAAPVTNNPTTSVPTTSGPTSSPITFAPTTAEPTTFAPTTSEPTTPNPTTLPTKEPTRLPTRNPTQLPTPNPSEGPTTANPTTQNPTINPSIPPTADPTSGIVDTTCCGCQERGERSNPGCASDPECEAIVCERVNRRCCNRRWNQPCVDEATQICQQSDLPQCCGCLVVTNDNPGCSADTQCTNTICATDPFCCSNEWDSICVFVANSVCNGDEIPSCCGCTVVDEDVGCSVDQQCETLVCAQDPFCCGNDPEEDGGSWDINCVNIATDICSGDA